MIDLVHRLSHASWTALGDAEREQLLRTLAGQLPGLRPTGLVATSGGPIGSFLHLDLGIRLHLIPGGRFRMGLIDEEEAAVSPLLGRAVQRARMTPVREVDVAPMLLAAEPLTPQILSTLVTAGGDPGVGGLAIGDRQAGTLPSRLLPDAIEALLHGGLRLPSEAEWEYACRAGSGGPFPVELSGPPVDPFLPSNGFGLVAMGAAAEICADSWRANHARARGDARASKGTMPSVVRGGGALTYPWQGTGEWAPLLCAWRRALAEDDSISIRVARSLFPDEIAYAAEAASERGRQGLVRRPARRFTVEAPDPAWLLAVAAEEARRFTGPWDEGADQAWRVPHLLARIMSGHAQADELLDAAIDLARKAGAMDALSGHLRVLLDGPARRPTAMKLLSLARSGQPTGELADEAQHALLASQDEPDVVAAAPALHASDGLDALVHGAMSRSADPLVRAALLWGLAKVDLAAAVARAETLVSDPALWVRATCGLVLDAAERVAPPAAIAALEEARGAPPPADWRWPFTALDKLAERALRRLEQRSMKPVQLESEALAPELLQKLLDADERPLADEAIVRLLVAELPAASVMPAVLGLVQGATVDGESGPTTIKLGARAVLAASRTLADPAAWARAYPVDPGHAPPPVAWAVVSILLATGSTPHELRERLPLLVSATLASPHEAAAALFDQLPIELRSDVLRARIERLGQLKSSLDLLARTPDADLLSWAVQRIEHEPRWGARLDDLRAVLESMGPAAVDALARLGRKP